MLEHVEKEVRYVGLDMWSDPHTYLCIDMWSDLYLCIDMWSDAHTRRTYISMQDMWSDLNLCIDMCSDLYLCIDMCSDPHIARCGSLHISTDMWTRTCVDMWARYMERPTHLAICGARYVDMWS
jgi:hypothetical protein